MVRPPVGIAAPCNSFDLPCQAHDYLRSAYTTVHGAATPALHVTKIMDSGATGHFTTDVRNLVPASVRSTQAHIQIYGSETRCTHTGDAFVVWKSSAPGQPLAFTEPKLVHGFSTVPKAEVDLFSEAGLEVDGVFRDTRRRLMYFAATYDGEVTATIPP